MRVLTAEEADVIEAAISLAFFREAAQYGPITKERMDAELTHFEATVSELHNAYDGQWRRPTGV